MSSDLAAPTVHPNVHCTVGLNLSPPTTYRTTSKFYCTSPLLVYMSAFITTVRLTNLVTQYGVRPAERSGDGALAHYAVRTHQSSVPKPFGVHRTSCVRLVAITIAHRMRITCRIPADKWTITNGLRADWLSETVPISTHLHRSHTHGRYCASLGSGP